MRLLVVEDQQNLRDIIARKLAGEGHAVDACEDGRDALDHIRLTEYDGIVPALEAVHRGQSVFGDSIRGKFTDLVGAKESFDYEKAGISEKEKGIIELVAKGQSNKEIAAELYLSEGTVRNYISGLLEKLELRDRTQLAVFYYTKIKK